VIQNLQHEDSIFLIALAGTAGMLLAIGFGVWASIRIGIGLHAKRRNAFTWWVINRLAFLAASVNVATFVLFYIQERFEEYPGNLAASPAARVMMVVGILILALAIPSGWLADRFGKRKLVAASGLLAAFGTAAALLAPGISGLYIGGLFIGAGVGLFYPANWALGTEIVPDDQAGRYFGLSNLAGAGAGAVGAYIGGPIADNQGYVLLFTIFGLLFLVSSLALWGVRGYKEA
jgi:MFS family permease